MNPFSICLIAKNEEKHIERCLSAASKLDAEIVLVDTGSTDKTKELATKYTDKIYDFEWCNDFSAARNFSISKATYDWILVLDCDEYVEKFDLDELLKIIQAQDYYLVGEITILNHIPNSTEIFGVYISRFFNKRFFHFEEKIHEQIRPIIDCTVKRKNLKFSVFHDGYAGSTAEKNNKSMRNASMLLDAIKNDPQNPYLYYNLGVAYSMAKDHDKALEAYQKALEFDIDPSHIYAQLLVISYGDTLLHLKKYEEALSLLNIYDEFATSADFICLIGLIYMYNNHPIQAILEFMKALTTEKHFRSDTNTNYPRYHIGLIYEMLGETEDAIKFYKSCPNYEPAIKKLEKYTL